MASSSSVVEWLLDSDHAVRWQVLRDVVGAPVEQWAEERAKVETEGLGAQLLSLQDDDGQWAGGAFAPKGFDWCQFEEFGQPWTATTWALTQLREFGLESSSQRARETVRLIGEHSRWDHAGQPFWDGEVEECINGRTIADGGYHIEATHAVDLVTLGGFGYLLKDRVLEVAEFLATAERVASGRSALDPMVVANLARPAATGPVGRLQRRELDVLELMAQGLANTAIANRLVISERTVEAHISHIPTKLDISDGENGHRRVLAVLSYLRQPTQHPRRRGRTGVPVCLRSIQRLIGSPDWYASRSVPSRAPV